MNNNYVLQLTLWNNHVLPSANKTQISFEEIRTTKEQCINWYKCTLNLAENKTKQTNKQTKNNNNKQLLEKKNHQDPTGWNVSSF